MARTVHMSRVLVLPLEDMSVDELNFSISRFICEVKKCDGTDFPSSTLHGLIIALQIHLDSIGKKYKLLSDGVFQQIRNTWDNAMKMRARNHGQFLYL